MSDKKLDQRILSCLLKDSATCRQFASSYDSTLFSDEYRRFAKMVLDYTKTFRNPPTRRTLTEYHAPNTDTISLINSTWDKVESIGADNLEFTYDLKNLKTRYQKGVKTKILTDAAEASDQSPDSFFKGMALKLQDVARLDLSRTYTQMPAGDYVPDFREKLLARKDQPEQSLNMKTGYSAIDQCCKGLSPAELIMIGGETNAGKSMFLNNLAVQLWMQQNNIDMKDGFSRGYNILYFSLEMPYEDCYNRFIASVADVPQFGITDPHENPLENDQQERLDKALEFVENYQNSGCYFDIVDTPRGCTIEEIELRYNDALLRYRPDVVVVDYMGLMHNPTFAKEQDWLRMGAIAASLHEFARAYDVVVVTAAQLTDIKRNQQGKLDESKRVGAHRWGRSSLIMHHVNLGIQIETRANERDYPDLRYHIVKNRKGPLAVGTLIKNFANAKLIDVEQEDESDPGDVSGRIEELKEKLRQKQREEE